MRSTFRRFFNFIVQLIFGTPLSLIINVMAIAPLAVLFGWVDFPAMNLIFIWPICWGIAFALNKLKISLKGKKVDDHFETEYEEYVISVTSDYDVSVSKRTGTEYSTSNTLWGWVGIFLSFIAFPIQIISLLFSFLSIFIGVIYSTTKRLPHDVYFSTFNDILHGIFDFVIIPSNVEKQNKGSFKGLLWTFVFILTVIVVLFIGYAVSALLFNVFAIDLPDFVSIIALLGFIAVAIGLIISIIKYVGLICYSYSKEEALKYTFKIAGISAIEAILLILIIL